MDGVPALPEVQSSPNIVKHDLLERSELQSSQSMSRVEEVVPPLNHDEPVNEDHIKLEEFAIAEKHEHGHYFYETSFSSPTYCTHCTGFIWGLRKQGYSCEVCKYTVHEKCRKLVTVDCYSPKLITQAEQISFEHHWLQGNVKKGLCIVCFAKISTKSGGFESCGCSRCAHQIHKKCLEKFQPLPSHAPETFHCRPKYGNLLFCNELLFADTPHPKYEPLLVFVNGKSGGQQGPLIIRELRAILTPTQVLDLFDHKPYGPGDALDKYGKVKNLKILVCGGDGTGGWVLNAMLDKRDDIINREWVPPIAMLPLGTGNDLARVLNWGGGYENGDKLEPIVRDIQSHSDIVIMDRWNVVITPTDDSAVSATPNKFVMNNYFSIGLDAAIALQFHLKRQSNPNLFKSRRVNKVIYGLYGTSKIVDVPPVVTEFGVEVLIDNDESKNIPQKTLKKLQCLVWSNIPSYAGGTILWKAPEDSQQFKQCMMDDHLLEVVGLKDIKHVVALTTNFSSGVKLVQGSTFKIRVDRECPIQVDGEPLLIGPSIIEISRLNQARMIKKRK